MASHQSTGLHPRKAAYVDTATILTNDSATAFSIPTGNDDISFVLFFSATAAGLVKINDQAGNLIKSVAAPSGGGRVLVEMSGYELKLAAVTGIKIVTTTFLTAGAVQVSMY